MRNITEDTLKLAHELTFNNRFLLGTTNKCGCFFCGKVYSTIEIEEWVGQDKDTALCPKCGIDTVLPESDLYDINDINFMKDMYDYWMTGGVQYKMINGHPVFTGIIESDWEIKNK